MSAEAVGLDGESAPAVWIATGVRSGRSKPLAARTIGEAIDETIEKAKIPKIGRQVTIFAAVAGSRIVGAEIAAGDGGKSYRIELAEHVEARKGEQ